MTFASEILSFRVAGHPSSLSGMQAPKQAFANTAHTLRIMEAMAAAVSQNEPLLLVGETGTGKTTTVQQLAGRVRYGFRDLQTSLGRLLLL